MGKWTVIVKDTVVNDEIGTFVDWRLNLWGEAIDGAKQGLHPLPTEHDDDHDIEDAIVATTSVHPGPTKTKAPGKPTDVADRPVNAKPTPGQGKPTPAEEDSTAPTPAESTTSQTTATEEAAAATTSSDSFLPGFFPTFGASKRTQVWIYAAIGSIIVFCIALGVYFHIQRQKRLRNDPRDDYDFEMIEDDEDLHAAGKPGGRTQRRGGELYNAFAGESDEEPLFSDDDEERYHDRSGSDDQQRRDSPHADRREA